MSETATKKDLSIFDTLASLVGLGPDDEAVKPPTKPAAPAVVGGIPKLPAPATTEKAKEKEISDILATGKPATSPVPLKPLPIETVTGASCASIRISIEGEVIVLERIELTQFERKLCRTMRASGRLTKYMREKILEGDLRSAARAASFIHNAEVTISV